MAATRVDDQGIDIHPVMLWGANGQPLLGTAAALSDAAANPTTTTVGADIQVFNGTTWDRAREQPATFSSNTPVGVQQVMASVMASSTNVSALAAMQAMSDGNTGANVAANGLMLFNGTTYERQRGNIDILLLASAARTATVTPSTQTNQNGRGIIVYLNVTAAPATAETLTINVISFVASQAVSSSPIASFTTPAGTVGVGVRTLHVYPGVGTLANPTLNGSVSAAVGRLFIVQIVPSGASSWTYDLGVQVNV